ncbi:MAG: hypothetical protein Kow0080_04990 [Candidatus Promineifilaceae bacterium]
MRKIFRHWLILAAFATAVSLSVLLWLNGRFLFLTASSTSPQIAYLDSAPDGSRQLFLLTLQTGETRQLTHINGRVVAYAISPDGKQVAYAGETNDSTAIHLMKVNGRVSRQLIHCPTEQCTHPVWSADGQRLLFEKHPDTPRPTLWWLDVASGETAPLLTDPTAIAQAASFSPDGEWIAYVSTPEEGLQLYHFATGKKLALASDVGTPAVWHPDGRSLLFRNQFIDTLHGNENDDHQGHSHDYSLSIFMFQYHLDDGRFTTLSQGYDLDDAFPAFSPDGEWIAFTRKKARVVMGRQVWLMRADGTEARALTEDATLTAGPPTWSADGRFLLFQRASIATTDSNPGLWLYDTQTDKLTQIHLTGYLPSWVHPHE